MYNFYIIIFYLDIDECQNSSACPETTFCLNTPGSYNCFCKDGYKRKGPHSDPKEDGCEGEYFNFLYLGDLEMIQ